MIDHLKAYWDKVNAVDLEATYELKQEYYSGGKLKIIWTAFVPKHISEEDSKEYGLQRTKEQIVQGIAQGKLRLYEQKGKE